MTGGGPLLRTAALAAVAVAVSAAPAANASANRAAAPRVPLRGTVSPLVAQGLAHVVGTPRASAPVTAVVAFKPRNAILLHWLAERSSGRPGMSNAQIDRLFAPRPAAVAAVRAYVASYGLSVVDSTDMSLIVSGTASQANRAFGVGLRLYRDARGTTYRAPSRNARLPRAIASVVQSVAGLDSSLRAHPHYQVAKHASAAPAPKVGAVPHAVAGCQDAIDTKTNIGGMLPSDLSSANGYNHDFLINRGSDGTGQTIGFVEFSNYQRGDATTFHDCFTGIAGTFAPDTTVGAGPTDKFGQVEVNLDLEVAMGAAPDATWKVYKAANNLALLPSMLARMRTDNVTVVSDSWGLCELFVPVKLTANENTALELLAVSGASFYVASGDDGSTDCRAQSPAARFLAIDDPSGQPFATAVGGTRLTVQPGHAETAWKGSGGGVSINWPKPEYQKGGVGVPNASGSFCTSGNAHCRVTPDIAMDAAPATGYIIRSHGLGGGVGRWDVIGGTSGAAPLMAAITADANEDAGQTLGFANPFIYQTLQPADFFDVTTGNNSSGTGTRWTAKVGFDLVTGRGSVKADAFAAALTTVVVTPSDTTKLTGTHPLNMKRVPKGKVVIFTGRLTNVDTPGPIPNRQIIVIGNRRIIGVVRTDTNGVWEIRARVTKRMSWHAIFMGSDREKPSLSPVHTVRIR